MLNKEQILKNFNNSLMLVTALNPKIGYSKSAEIAKLAFEEKLASKEAAKKLKYLITEFDKIVDPENMI